MNYLMTIIFAALFMLSCGKKNKATDSEVKNSYWQEEAWNYRDDDADGITNEEEIKRGTHPELINPPDLSSFNLSNVSFYINGKNTLVNEQSLIFEIDHRPINQYFLSIMSSLTNKGELPFQSYLFKKEHVSVQTASSFLLPNVLQLKPRINLNYLNFLKKKYYTKKIDTSFIRNNPEIQCNITLNFPANLKSEKWTKIEGELQWGGKTVPWKWTKEQDSQNNWQITINSKEWLNVLLDKSTILFTIKNWEISTPIGLRSFDQKSLENLTPFYVLSTVDSKGGWYNTKYPLPAETIIKRPTENNDSKPWLFLRLENTQNTLSTYWLKELGEDENGWIDNGSPLKWSHRRFDEDLEYIALPPHKMIKSLKIHVASEVYQYKTLQDPINTATNTGQFPCVSEYPVFPPQTVVHIDNVISLDRMFDEIHINNLPLRELINSKIYLTLNYSNNNEISSLILNWPSSFQWNQFSIKGLERHKRLIKLGDTIAECGKTIDSSNKYWPIYRAETLHFEWLP